MITLKNINVNLDTFSLNNVSFHLPKGYIMLLAGQNGSGKSSLIKSILNIYQKSSGNIIIDNMNIDEDENKIKNIIGTILDENFFIDELSSKENANLVGKLYSDFNYRIFENYISKFNIDINKPLKKLSKGNSIKFQLAFALSHDAKFFIMDEPFANIDSNFNKELIKIIIELINDGDKSIIISTHIVEELENIADYIGIMKNGELAVFETKENLIDKYSLINTDKIHIKSIPNDLIICKEKNIYNINIFVKNKEYYKFNSILDVKKPTLEETIYYLIKGGINNDKIIF